MTPELARALVDSQFPQWRGLALERVGTHGTVNAVFRLGDHLTARFPMQEQDLAAEAAAARELLGASRFATPAPVAMGSPGLGFPRPWAVQTWLPGAMTSEDSHSDNHTFAYDLAEFIHGVRALDTRGRPFRGHGRGGHLPDHDAWIETCLRESEGLLDVASLRRLWARFRELPRESPDVMTHGDLIPGNLLASGDHLSGVLDVGGLGPADPALDLICAWHLFDAGTREVFRRRVGAGDLDWERGRAWAFEQVMGLIWYYRETNPLMARLGRSTLHRITTGS
ncbi:putative phosphotransferase [Actinoplanes cyaneus]|uniref:Phosphotransferase n=1 Tax=Actinoplanes cyaneus TaxID=52696 RepID=A0A919IBP9_9ACTN|nr:aminoglycoside phosphotransferase family protein [Actinoplanes cyaneus]MCW2136099.1 putative kinase, aminoglycoside phosphotransferase (APT) family [Actinoplanes cyaneus]GID62532.1 putative phosphotransferase [Actinoplanes cyaneus]